MKKEGAALLLLGAIVLLSIWNLRAMDRLMEPLLSMTEEVFHLAEAGDLETAALLAEEAEDDWLRAGSYTHIFLRHPEIDAVTDAFCAFRGALAGEDPGEILGSYLSLRVHLSGIREMEQPRLGCVF